MFPGRMGTVSSEGMPLNAAAAGSQDPDDRTGAVTARVAKLTRGQLDCLLLVDQHLSSKEIAAELNISPHTVDQRIRGALHILAVERRTQAARLVEYLGKPEVSETRFAMLINEYVRGLDIAMQHVLPMRIVDRTRYLHDNSDGDANRREVRSRSVSFGELLRETLLHELHRDVMVSVLFAKFVDRHNVWMRKARGRFCFQSKASQAGGRCHHVPANEFQGHDPLKAFLPRAKHHSHSPARDLFQEFVVAEREELYRVGRPGCRQQKSQVRAFVPFWIIADADLCRMAESESVGNLKRVWTGRGRTLDWYADAAAGEGFLRRAVEVKNVWVPYGD